MGYYVRIAETASNFKIKKENFERGYEIMCDLNTVSYTHLTLPTTSRV